MGRMTFQLVKNDFLGITQKDVQVELSKCQVCKEFKIVNDLISISGRSMIDVTRLTIMEHSYKKRTFIALYSS